MSAACHSLNPYNCRANFHFLVAFSLLHTCTEHNDVLNTFTSCLTITILVCTESLNEAFQIQAIAIDSHLIATVDLILVKGSR